MFYLIALAILASCVASAMLGQGAIWQERRALRYAARAHYAARKA